MFENICKIICEGERCNLEDLKQDTNQIDVVYPRQLIMFFAYEFKTGSNKLIGDFFGRDHATVLHARKVIRNYYNTDKVKRQSIDEYREKITGIKKVIDICETLRNQVAPINLAISEMESRLVNINLTVRSLEEYIKTLEKPKITVISKEEVLINPIGRPKKDREQTYIKPYSGYKPIPAMQ